MDSNRCRIAFGTVIYYDRTYDANYRAVASERSTTEISGYPGFAIFFLYSLAMYYEMTPYTSTEEFFWPLVIRGIGLGLLFVPITTLSLSSLKGRDC